MPIENLLLLIAIIMFLSALPVWPYSRQWGYTPTAVLGVILIFVILWVISSHKQTSNVGEDIKEGVEEAAEDVKDSVRNMVQ